LPASGGRKVDGVEIARMNAPLSGFVALINEALNLNEDRKARPKVARSSSGPVNWSSTVGLYYSPLPIELFSCFATSRSPEAMFIEDGRPWPDRVRF
jgi:hypothetical protein